MPSHCQGPLCLESTGPIRGQYSGHVITLDQSEARQCHSVWRVRVVTRQCHCVWCVTGVPGGGTHGGTHAHTRDQGRRRGCQMSLMTQLNMYRSEWLWWCNDYSISCIHIVSIIQSKQRGQELTLCYWEPVNCFVPGRWTVLVQLMLECTLWDLDNLDTIIQNQESDLHCPWCGGGLSGAARRIVWVVSTQNKIHISFLSPGHCNEPGHSVVSHSQDPRKGCSHQSQVYKDRLTRVTAERGQTWSLLPYLELASDWSRVITWPEYWPLISPLLLGTGHGTECRPCTFNPFNGGILPI